MKKLLNILVYLGLLAGGLKVVWDAIEDYKKGSTDYSTRTELLTLKDLPTLTFCFDGYEYGSEDFMIKLKVIEKDQGTVTLVLDQKVATLYQLEFHFSELLMVESRKKCFKSI